MSSAINSKGGEDSPFITPDSKDFYFFFTPDVSKEASLQLTDEVTGIYWSKSDDDDWTEPERVVLQERDKLSLDDCLFAQGNVIWFCSAREGNMREIDIYIAYLSDGKWTDWVNAGELLNVDYGLGELHITSGGNQIYFHPEKAGGMDIWVTNKSDRVWQEPELIISQFAGEASLDNESNIYFTHHFYKDAIMLEADIYVAYRK